MSRRRLSGAAHSLDDIGKARVLRVVASGEIGPELGILEREQSGEIRLLSRVQPRIVLFEKTKQDQIQLFHAAAATPPQATDVIHTWLARLCLQRRSMISFLISAMALAGFSPLGQVRAQFMIVWQR